MKAVSAREAKHHFGQLIDEARAEHEASLHVACDEAVVFESHGQAVSGGAGQAGGRHELSQGGRTGFERLDRLGGVVELVLLQALQGLLVLDDPLALVGVAEKGYVNLALSSHGTPMSVSASQPQPRMRAPRHSRSGPCSSQIINGISHTQWWVQEIGDNSSPNSWTMTIPARRSVRPSTARHASTAKTAATTRMPMTTGPYPASCPAIREMAPRTD